MEDRIAAGIDHTERGLFVRMSPQAVDLTCERIQEAVKKLITAGHSAIILVSPRIRPGLRQITSTAMPQLRVLSYNEITQDTKIESYGAITDQ
jgi:flagellar biosynthesis protein FlhA